MAPLGSAFLKSTSIEHTDFAPHFLTIIWRCNYCSKISPLWFVDGQFAFSLWKKTKTKSFLVNILQTIQLFGLEMSSRRSKNARLERSNKEALPAHGCSGIYPYSVYILLPSPVAFYHQIIDCSTKTQLGSCFHAMKIRMLCIISCINSVTNINMIFWPASQVTHFLL